MARRITENEILLGVALEGFLVTFAVIIVFVNCVTWLKWQQELTVLKEQTKYCYFTKSTTKKNNTQFVLVINLMPYKCMCFIQRRNKNCLYLLQPLLLASTFPGKFRSIITFVLQRIQLINFHAGSLRSVAYVRIYKLSSKIIIIIRNLQPNFGHQQHKESN